METLATILDAPITWMNAATDSDLRDFLDDLQANILKGHGRHHAAHMFLSFAGMAPADAATVVRTLGQHCTSAYKQLRSNKRLPPYLDGGTVRCLFISASGYRALGAGAFLAKGSAFQSGMESRGALLGDPERSQWNPDGWRGPAPDAMFLVADADPDKVTADLEATERWLNGTGATILVIERALQQTRSFRPGRPEGVEHFGYVDGRSQPLFLTEDIQAEDIPSDPPGTPPSKKAHWDPAFKPSQFIVPDPNGQTELSAGSYFVFRKLEQNVRGFNGAENGLGEAIFGGNANQDQLDRAGAMVVGRFEDGTPLTLSPTGTKEAVTNDFSYAADANGRKCPFHAHIRKVNPRGDIERITAKENPAPGRIRIMARRGITYGPERPHNADGSEFADAGHEPIKDVGLLFMAYMTSLEDQFEFTQRSWANNPAFVGNINPENPHSPTGIDSIIGQSANPSDRQHTYLDGWTPSAQPKTLSFDKFVTLQGGEYFFAPSLSFLRSVGLEDNFKGS
jgi:Dyp-type peroxidase family